MKAHPASIHLRSVCTMGNQSVSQRLLLYSAVSCFSRIVSEKHAAERQIGEILPHTMRRSRICSFAGQKNPGLRRVKSYRLLCFPVFLLRQPSAEESAFKQGNDEEEDIRENDEDEGRNQDAGILLPAAGSFTDMVPHAGQL